MTTIAPLHVLTHRQLQRRDWRTAIITLSAVASIGYAAHVVTITAGWETPPAVVTGDALRVAAHVCRRNDGVRLIEPGEDNTVRFRCRDGASFDDIVVRLE